MRERYPDVRVVFDRAAALDKYDNPYRTVMSYARDPMRVVLHFWKSFDSMMDNVVEIRVRVAPHFFTAQSTGTFMYVGRGRFTFYTQEDIDVRKSAD